MQIKPLITALKKVKSEKFELSEDRNMIGKLINLIASRTLKPDSIHFKIIATQLRIIMDRDLGSKDDSKNYIHLPERDIPITKKESELYQKLENDENRENLYRMLLGVPAREVESKCCYDTNEMTILHESKGIYDCVLESLMNKDIIESEDFANELFNTDVIKFNNVFTK